MRSSRSCDAFESTHLSYLIPGGGQSKKDACSETEWLPPVPRVAPRGMEFLYRVIDLDARILERNVGRDPRPEILDQTVAWSSVDATEPLAIDLPAYFARVYGEGDAI